MALSKDSGSPERRGASPAAADPWTALRAGDRRAAERLVEESYEMIYAALFKLTGGDVDLAADLTQETYRKAWRALGGFDGRSKFSTWLYRIAYNTFLNHLRRPQLVRSFAEGEEAEVEEERTSVPEEEAMQGESAARLRRAILELPEDLRYVVTARYWGELSAREIAEQAGITPTAVRKRLRNAYARLELALQEI